MRVFGVGGAEMFMMLFWAILQLAIIAAAVLALYWIIRKAVCAGMEDFERKKAGRQ